ncbi:MAG TPA: terminase TerL endonuclease subunit [Acidisarcina sp.]|nr:terminase TerL endonuclease subunit [Acidisarcina sp.]
MTHASSHNPHNKAEQYIADVLCEKQVVSKWVRLAIERHISDLESGPSRGLRFDPVRGRRVIDFIERFIPGTEGEFKGKPFILEPWMAALLYISYGWVWAENSQRRFKVAYVEISRGNLKSTLASALAIYELISVAGANVYSASTDKESAKVVFDTAVRMRDLSPSLAKRIQSFRNNLSSKSTGSKFVPCSAEAKTLFQASRPSFVVLDELHLHPTADVWNAFWSALEKRSEAWLLAITNSGWDRHSVCWTQREYTTKVLLGIIPDDSRFGWICGLDDEDLDPANPSACLDNEAIWVKANPSMGHAVSIAGLRRHAMEGKSSPAMLNEVLRFHFSVWTESHSVWMPMDKWDVCSDPIDLAALKGLQCFGGLDLSSTTDITAFVLLFPPQGDLEKWVILPHFFLPADNIRERVRKDHVPYDIWARQGLFTLTPGNLIDQQSVREKINQLADIYRISEIAFDPWNSSEITTHLHADGHTLVQVRQGSISMNPPMKRIMELVLRHEISHGGNPVLRWMASNVVAGVKAGLLYPDKDKCREKIDGISATLTALARGMVVPIAPPKRKHSFLIA